MSLTSHVILPTIIFEKSGLNGARCLQEEIESIDYANWSTENYWVSFQTENERQSKYIAVPNKN